MNFMTKKQEFKTEGRKCGSSLLSRHVRQRLLDNISVGPPSLPLLAALMSLRHRHRLWTPKLAQAAQHHAAEPNRTMTGEAVELVGLIYSLDGLHPGMLRSSAYVWFLYTRKGSREHDMRDLVILGPQPVIDAGSGRCFWRASTHPDQEMAMTGKRQREGAGGGGSGDGGKKRNGAGQQAGAAGGASARPELPGACVCASFSSQRERC